MKIISYKNAEKDDNEHFRSMKIWQGTRCLVAVLTILSIFRLMIQNVVDDDVTVFLFLGRRDCKKVYNHKFEVGSNIKSQKIIV